MTNKELIAELSKRMSVSQKNVGTLLQAYVETLTENIVEERQTPFLSVGCFVQHAKNERMAVNPATKENCIVPAKKTVSFKSSSTLKNYLKTLAAV
ncbi:MAG: HU family DNA-binding protein [Prevotellaceae bacterium]|jgi:DNA-binding protein HU-beta|nr:HU family DNA-binding protein [Prevotellaceae bacterium]